MVCVNNVFGYQWLPGTVCQKNVSFTVVSCLSLHKHFTHFPSSLLPCWPSDKGVRLGSARPGFGSCLGLGSFSRSSHTSDLNMGTPVATLQDTGSCRASTRTGWLSVSIPTLARIVMCNFYLSVAAH